MGKRLSQAQPRMSIVNMAGIEEPERKHSVRDFLCANVKTIVTVFMIFGTILCIVLIVMVHQWKFESHHAEHVQASPTPQSYDPCAETNTRHVPPTEPRPTYILFAGPPSEDERS